MLPENTPTFDEENRKVTLPEVRYVQWLLDGKEVKPGKHSVKEGKSVEVEAVVEDGVRVGGPRGQRKFTFGE